MAVGLRHGLLKPEDVLVYASYISYIAEDWGDEEHLTDRQGCGMRYRPELDESLSTK